MIGGTEQSGADLAAQIRAELSDSSPEGFHFSDHVVRQDDALQRLIQNLEHYPDRAEVEHALSRALRDERDGWVLLKLLELVEHLALTGVAPALVELAQRPTETERGQFLAGRACEVLLKLPLDLNARTRANQVCKVPLQQVARYRLGADRERRLHRPRRIEWLLLVLLMVAAIAALIFAATALGRR
jgi:hypothetical protein